MRIRTLSLVLASLSSLACDPADDVRIQELPPLAQSSIEARLGLPVVEGAWRFAGWELAEGDSLGLEAEIPTLGVLALQSQQRDSLAGYYLTAGGGRAPVEGEVRRDSVVALVAFLQEGDGRYLVGSVHGDTLWVEASTLVDPEGWRAGARPAFVRSRTALTPFLRLRGAVPPPPPVDSAALAAASDSLELPGGRVSGQTQGEGRPGGAAEAGERRQPPAAREPVPTRPTAAPVTEPPPQAEPEAPARQPELAPAIEQRDPPRILGVPVVRDTAGNQ